MTEERKDRRWCCSSGVEDDETLGPLLVHDPVSAFPASDGVSGPDLVLGVALAADVDHRVTDAAGSVGRGAGLRIHDRGIFFSTWTARLGRFDSKQIKRKRLLKHFKKICLLV